MGETPEEAIIREFKEEVGLDVVICPIRDEPVWGQTDDFLDDQWRCFIYILMRIDPKQEPKVRFCILIQCARISNPLSQVLERTKHVAAKWMAWTELWANIEATTRGEYKAHSSDMEPERYFQTLVNMVLKYPKRDKIASLRGNVMES